MIPHIWTDNVNTFPLRLLKPQHTPDELRLAYILGWCVEFLQAFFLVTDDVMDGSTTRRGQSCWHLKVRTLALSYTVPRDSGKNNVHYLQNCPRIEDCKAVESPGQYWRYKDGISGRVIRRMCNRALYSLLWIRNRLVLRPSTTRFC